MPTEKLDLEERLKVLQTQRGYYHKGSRTEKGRTLDALESVTHPNRKRVILRLKGGCQRKRRRKERGRSYVPT